MIPPRPTRFACSRHGLAIIALAVCVKLLLFPLTKVAERLQEQVNATQARLQPGLDAINAAHRGEERTRRTLALYREAGVHPFYTLRSLAGFLIQLPVFIAVFDMLAEDFDLHGVRFLWIRDLARPDELWRLPACLPFFGCHLNLLPVLMSSISIAAVLRARSAHLTPALIRRQRRNLMQFLVEAIKKANSVEADKVSKALLGLSVDTPVGKLTIREKDHQANRGQLYGKTVKDAKYPFPIMKPVTYVDPTKFMD